MNRWLSLGVPVISDKVTAAGIGWLFTNKELIFINRPCVPNREGPLMAPA